VSRSGIDAKNINSYLIEQLARASHLPTTRFGNAKQAGLSTFDPKQQKLDAALNKNLNVCRCGFS